jgi:hypothetical protein
VKIYNFLSTLLECVQRWERLPTAEDFLENYYAPMKHLVRDVFDDGQSLYGALYELDWKAYREQLLTLDPKREQARVTKHLQAVEQLFGFKLEGEIILFGSFETMDGYARFEKGAHRVYLGVDESHAKPQYLDILEVHELTHVARESRHAVWTGWYLDPKMSHDVFVEVQPTIEHVFGEGFSCAVSEILVPCDEPWHYAYQEKKDYLRILKNAKAVDLSVHREIKLGSDGDWSRLYDSESYQPPLPTFTHYLWGWHWTRQLIERRAGGDPKNLIEICSKEFIQDALEFRLAQ